MAQDIHQTVTDIPTLSNLARVLAMNVYNGASIRNELRAALDKLDAPVTYSNEDFDRFQRFSNWLDGAANPKNLDKSRCTA